MSTEQLPNGIFAGEAIFKGVNEVKKVKRIFLFTIRQSFIWVQ